LLDAEDLRSGVEGVVRLAGDADTNGAVAGALLGARFGARGIPSGWLVALLRKEELLDQL
jgi:ADP-ribosylglycohydrolase